MLLRAKLPSAIDIFPNGNKNDKRENEEKVRERRNKKENKRRSSPPTKKIDQQNEKEEKRINDDQFRQKPFQLCVENSNTNANEGNSGESPTKQQFAPQKPPRQFHYLSVQQLIASPHLPSHQHHSSIGVIDPISADATTTTSTTMPSSMMPSSTISYSSPQQHNHQQRQIRPIRVAQPPQPFPSTTMPYTSFPSGSSGNTQQMPSFISVPTLHSHENSNSSDTSAAHFTRSAASTSALAERFGRMSYEELIDLARNQQRQIEANEAELDERRKAVALFGVARRTAGSETEQQQNAKMLMASLRAQIEQDEKELAQLSQNQKEARQLREHNQNQKRELQQLESEYTEYEQQLRGSVQKVDSLRNQLEIMYQRRAAAADAAVAMQRQINGIAGSMDGKKMSAERRPKASVSPFKSSESQSVAGHDETDCSTIAAKKSRQPLASTSSSYQPPLPQQKSSTSIQTINWRREYQPNNNDYTYQNGSSGSSLLPPAVDKISLRRNSINQAKRNSLISESGDEHVLALLLAEQRRGGKTHMSFGRSWDGQSGIGGLGGGSGGGGLVANAKASLGLNDKKNGILSHKKELGERREPGKLLKKDEQQNAKTKLLLNTVTVSTEPEESLDTPKVVDEQPKHQNNPSLSPVKSSSANGSPVKNVSSAKKAATLPSEMNFSEFNRTFDQQKRNREEENKDNKGKEEICLGTSSESEEESGKLEPKTTQNEAQNVVILEENEERKNEGQEDEKETKTKKHQIEDEKDDDGISSCGQMLGQIQLRLDESMAKFAAHLNLDDEEEAATIIGEDNRVTVVLDREEKEGDQTPLPNSPTNSSNSAESEEKEEFQFDKSWHPQPSGAKSILRRQDTKNGMGVSNKRRVKIDLIVLFLDVAYEGHCDDLVELVESGQIENISVANSEGITALHYAICADNIQIVRFLIEHEADVNALDFDAWSPLHCAASCNNLTLMQLLIENGACPFATTISKFETASQLFDSTSDYSEPAEYMTLVEECMGEVNDRKVYAAYSYQAANCDELDFEEGDELRVLRKREIDDDDYGEDEEEGPNRKRKKNGKENDDDSKEEEEEINDENEHMEGDERNQLWWLCENVRTGKRGFIPRNYLALFPTRKHRNRYQIHFQLPQYQHRQAMDTDEEDQIGGDEDGHQMGNSAILNVVQNGKPLGHQELSTYA